MFEIALIICICTYIALDLWYDWETRKRLDKMDFAIKSLVDVLEIMDEDKVSFDLSDKCVEEACKKIDDFYREDKK